MSLALHTLKPGRGSTRRPKRIGRGNASGHGTYSTRGQKGQRSRSGGRKGLRALGMRRLILSTPKARGFKSAAPPSCVVNLSDLDRVVASGDVVTRERLVASGLIAKGEQQLKILGDGAFTKAVTIRGIPVSGSAREKI
ncbi:50S ribosomal protein L15, partial [Candidatus Uhrbacteria bacterium]|nr:50S ribosomal protein L15 [Candidatus Uhrbacteria bacterium]